MFYQIIFITSTNYSYKFPMEVKVFPNASYVDANTIKYENVLYSFDYLIFDDLNLLNGINVRKENKKAITNYELQTSEENIFYISSDNIRSIEDQLNSIFEYLKG